MSLDILKSKAIAIENLQKKYPKVGLSDSVYLGYIQESSVFSARIHALLKPGLPVQEIRLYMEILLEAGGRGPFYAWRFYQSGTISPHTMKTIVSTISESGRLSLVGEYLKTTPFIRRRYAGEFKSILRGITGRDNVTAFFARLFDKEIFSDPFLTNLDPGLRDPATLVSTDLISSDPEQRAIAIKALSIMVPRIDPGILVSLLTSDEDKRVHSSVLEVIEASPRNAYPELFDTLLELVCTGKQETMVGFRALVMSTPFSLLGLVDTIQARAPHLMDFVFDELAKLSRISFLFLQEMAMDRNAWLNGNQGIYKALVYGMIKKRPERIIKLLETYGDENGTNIQKNVTDLAKTVASALAKEKQEITATGEELRLNLSSNHKTKLKLDKNPGFFKKILAGSLKKRLLNLRQGTGADRLDFSHEILDNIDLSWGIFFSPTAFNNSIIQNSDFSFSSFVNASFHETCFSKVNLNGASFESISFDGAVFINVSANSAIFINCSFENASFFGANFESARMIDCILTGADISNSLFLKADLSGSTFACTSTANVSFVESILVDSDFSGVQARFTRFPSHTVSTLESESPNFNARQFHFDKKELPDLLFNMNNGFSGPQYNLVYNLDLLMLTDFLYAGEKMFLKQNKFSLLAAFDIFKPKQADFFEMVPLLIHQNIDFPGYIANDGNTPCGIANYRPCRQAIETAARYVDGKKIKYEFNLSPRVEGLFVMGSTGTIAQAPDSDIDYWVCVYDHRPDSPKGQQFQKKLTLLERWALNTFKKEIHFFIVDINKARIDDFGGSTRESSGSAQGLILKEEFYRTMIHIAGKLPFWCTLPVSISRGYHDLLLDKICKNPLQCRFINFGDIHEIPSEEYFGASIWQLFKLLKSPFKSVIKMALLEEFIHASGKKQLLCNRFKDQWMNSGIHSALGKIDPYYILLMSLVDYYEGEENFEAAKLVQRCFFLKTGISQDSDLDQTLFGFRSVFISRCMKKWSWNRKMVFGAGGFKDWGYADITKLSRQIQNYMIKTYLGVNKAMKKDKTSMITPEDRTILGRKIFVEFSNQPGKISKILLVSRSDRHFAGLTLKYQADQGKQKGWALINRSEYGELIKQGKTIEEIAAWFIHNQLFSAGTIINLFPNPTPVSSDDIQMVFHDIHHFFIYDNKESIRSRNLLSQAKITAIFVSLNLCIPRKTKRVHEFSAIYTNSWGEMFCINVLSKEGFSSKDEVKEQLKIELKVDKLPVRTFFYFPRGFFFKTDP